MAPNQTEATIFISKAMRLVPYRDRLDLSLLQKRTSASQSPVQMDQADDEQAEAVVSLRDQLSSILGHKNMT